MGCLSVFGELLDFGGIFVVVLDFLKICKDFVFSFLKNTENRIASSNPNKFKHSKPLRLWNIHIYCIRNVQISLQYF